MAPQIDCMMRTLMTLGCFAVFVALVFAGQSDEKADYSKLAEAIHKMVVAKAPKVHEDLSQWGRTIPVPEFLRLPRLPRARMMVNGREQLPHGVWKRYKAWLDDPAKDIQLTVREFKIGDGGKVRLVLDATADVHAEADWKPWQKGLPLPGLYARADARILLGLECEAKVSLDFKKFPPDATVEPKIDKATIELQEFELLKVANRIVGVEGDPVRDAGRELKGFLQDMAKRYEPQVIEQMNKAIASSLKDGKATIPAADYLRLFGGGKK